MHSLFSRRITIGLCLLIVIALSLVGLNVTRLAAHATNASATITLSKVSGPPTTTVTINGAINAPGGNNVNACFNAGGSGAGGAVRLVANTIQGNGNVNVSGAGACNVAIQAGGSGFARFESNNLGGVNVSGPNTRSTPFALNLPTTPAPSMKVTSINGQTINSNPFIFPDLTINTTAQVPVTIQAQYVPAGTIAKIYVFSEVGADQVINIGPLTATGTDQTLTTATANITYPPGGSRGYVKATW